MSLFQPGTETLVGGVMAQADEPPAFLCLAASDPSAAGSALPCQTGSHPVRESLHPPAAGESRGVLTAGSDALAEHI
jgi:hypothetical protein